jgi:sucrose phosphorylase
MADSSPQPALPVDLARLLRAQLHELYGPAGDAAFARLQALLSAFMQDHPPRAAATSRARLAQLSAADAMVITYGDQLQQPGQAPLATLENWLSAHLGDLLSSVHILPFYPYSSDDGFSVIDYAAVDPALGDWSDIERLSRRFKLMFDAVINHISAESAWFQAFLQGDPRYADYFITVDQPADLSAVTRPRTHPLLTTFETAGGPRRVWTTFSADQIDLNVQHPDVLLALIDVLLGYVAHGARYLRLDAIGYLWKTIGTRCIHLPETHRAVQLIRAVLDVVAPDVLLITETNVPHADNISYFGDGFNEAQLVYQFPLAPLLLNAFQHGDARHLQAWAAGLSTPSDSTTFFNFLASHDGIGVMPAVGILSAAELDELAAMTLRHGGRVSYKTNSDGSQSAYELNITLFDALSDPAATPEPVAIDRFIAAQAIMLALAGLPGIYIHSLVGSRNDLEGLARTGHNRTINRRKWQRAEIDARLADPQSREAQVLARYRTLLSRRASSPAFSPTAAQTVLPSDAGLFVVLRGSSDGEQALCLHNLSAASQQFTLDPQLLGHAPAALHDLLSPTEITLAPAGLTPISVAPYGVHWLRLVR